MLEPTVAIRQGRNDAASHDRAPDDAAARMALPDDEAAAWAARAAQGEPGAFGRFYERHVDAVYRYVHFRVRDDALAQDLTHDVFVRALDGVRGLREPRRAGGWLLRIAHNLVANHWRRRDARPEDVAADRGGAGDGDEKGERAAEGASRAFDGVEARVDAERAWAAAAALTDLQREVVALRFVAGLSLIETATAMGRSVNAVKNLQHHALRTLRDRLVGAAADGEEDAHERESR